MHYRLINGYLFCEGEQIPEEVFGRPFLYSLKKTKEMIDGVSLIPQHLIVRDGPRWYQSNWDEEPRSYIRCRLFLLNDDDMAMLEAELVSEKEAEGLFTQREASLLIR